MAMLHSPAAVFLRQRACVVAQAMCLLLGGCMLLPQSAGDVPIRQARAGIAAFTLDGRLAVHQGERHYASNISWQHSAGRDDMLFTTPLGQGLAELIRTPGVARLIFSDRREVSADDWEELAVQVLNIPLPLTALPRWLVAEAPATAQAVERDGMGRLQRLRIDGWQIDYLDYENESANALPILIELHRDDIAARLKIDEWSLVR